MPRYPCPICGDPNAFPLWIDSEPPATCANDPAWPRRSLHSICSVQIQRAKQAAELRRITPDAFDDNGTMIPGQSGRAWHNWINANPDKPVLI